jgi:protein-S-isoprenylcysteine O-methyltransferase
MNTHLASLLGALYAASEIGLWIFKRAAKGAAEADQGSLGLLWIVIVASVFLAFALAHQLPAFGFGPVRTFRALGSALFAFGIAFRWYAIIYLGRFFSVNVAIAPDHRLIDTGPYRFVRHPSYTGALMAFAGLGICICNWAALLVVLIPILLVFLRRMRIEEAALAAAFGDQYTDYMRRTKRLIPAIY